MRRGGKEDSEKSTYNKSMMSIESGTTVVRVHNGCKGEHVFGSELVKELFKANLI